MKLKTFVILLMCSMVSTKLSAQMSIHPMVGGSLNTVHFFDEKNPDINSIWGYHIGAGFDIPLGDVVSLEPILRFNQKGFGLEGSEDWGFGPVIKTTMSFKYSLIELPVMVNFNTEVGDVKLVYSVGPYAGYAVAVHQVYTITDGINSETKDSKDDPNFMQKMVDLDMNRFDFGLIAGARLEVSNFTLGINGAMSGQNLVGKTLENANKHMNLQLTVGYKIEL